jgi:hypothetical protein
MRKRLSTADSVQNALRVVEATIGAPLRGEPRKADPVSIPEEKPSSGRAGKLGGMRGGMGGNRLSLEERKEITPEATKGPLG